MPDQPQDRRPHLVLTNTSTAQAFTAPSLGGGTPEVPAPDRAQHGTSLKAQLVALKPVAQQVVAAQQEQGLESGLGLQVQFAGIPDVALAFEGLGREVGKDARKKIELLSIRTEAGTTYANVFVPDGKLDHFEKYVEDYLAARKNVKGHLLDHHALLNTISSIRRAEVRAMWTDDPALLPQNAAEAF